MGHLVRIVPRTLTAADLMSRGLFHDHIPPAIGASGLGPAMPDLLTFAADDTVVNGRRIKPKVTTRCVRHSHPKRRLARRLLSIPHPRNQIFLAIEVARHWEELLAICRKSPVSLTTPMLSINRSIQGSHERKSEGIERAKRSVGTRYVLHADLARFYPSIYTHSIPWAIHGKDRRNDRSNDLYGNLLDLWVRETQSGQTGGIPVGPDTSYLLAEVIASVIDFKLSESLGSLRGTRYIDDYHLYFDSRSDAEHAVSELHRIASIYELDINDLKTQIDPVPEAIEPSWKTQLRSVIIQKADHATSFKAAFDLAAMLAAENPQDGVFAYLVKKIEATIGALALSSDDWEIVDALLLRAAVGEPACLPTILRIFEQHDRQPRGAETALNSICLHHAALQQSNEVAWGLWTARRLEVSLTQAAADAVAEVDDDIVALVALDLHSRAQLPIPRVGFTTWQAYMTSEGLYSEHWMLAYEAFVQGWLPSLSGRDYVSDDPYFSILKRHEVRFFDNSDDLDVPEDKGYNDEGDDEDDQEDDEDDQEDDEDEEDEDVEDEDEEGKDLPY